MTDNVVDINIAKQHIATTICQELLARRVDILSNPNFLSEVLQYVKIDLHVDENRFNYLVDQYGKKYHLDEAQFNNLTKELNNPELTWKTFVKALDILQQLAY